MNQNFVKLSKITSRKVGKTVYHKFIITIPKGLTEELGWTEKTQLSMRVEPKTDAKRLVIEKE
jgi:bifunctional DNA-binding transcriptional regulator/antitoxin component of YhaV-PrlF toxin-antitoxin module